VLSPRGAAAYYVADETGPQALTGSRSGDFTSPLLVLSLKQTEESSAREAQSKSPPRSS
jgi:hypothetical protein